MCYNISDVCDLTLLSMYAQTHTIFPSFMRYQ